MKRVYIFSWRIVDILQPMGIVLGLPIGILGIVFLISKVIIW
jgi:hypothetical protein